jgi:PHD/YefM family antitoxin component YafN of YafNO toxin-antitoxin module
VVATLCGYLGIQDAPRKHRAPSKIPVTWAGSNVIITADGVAVAVTVSQEKWDKMKLMVNKWRD